jgi:hypothetical protein
MAGCGLVERGVLDNGGVPTIEGVDEGGDGMVNIARLGLGECVDFPMAAVKERDVCAKVKVCTV